MTRAPAADVDVRCGGRPMVDIAAPVVAPEPPEPGLDEGSLTGKRYVIPAAEDLELLCTKPGRGTLSIGTEPLETRSAKPLPSSD